jgi:hypothetical protein
MGATRDAFLMGDASIIGAPIFTKIEKLESLHAHGSVAGDVPELTPFCLFNYSNPRVFFGLIADEV